MRIDGKEREREVEETGLGKRKRKGIKSYWHTRDTHYTSRIPECNGDGECKRVNLSNFL